MATIKTILSGLVKTDTAIINQLLHNRADKEYVDSAISSLVNSAPETLNTLKELSDALSGDANFATTVVNLINTKQDIIDSEHKLSASFIDGLNDALSGKVDKVQGKSLISDAEIARLLELDNYDDSQIRTAISGKQDIINAEHKLSASFIEGIPTLPDDLATEGYVDQKVADLVNSAPTTLDTLKELSDALSGDANFASTVMTQIGKKVDKVQGESLISDTEIARLAGVNNYDDTELRTAISGKQNVINAQNKLSAAFISGLDEGGSSSSDEYITISSNTTVQNGKRYICQNISGLTVTLPQGDDGKFIEIAAQELGVNKSILINAGSNQTISGQTSLELDKSYSSIKLIYDEDDSNWKMVTPFVPSIANIQESSIVTLTSIDSTTTLEPNGHYLITLSANATFNAIALDAGKTGAAEIFLIPGSYTFTAGTNLVLGNALTANKVNYCTLNWYGSSCRMFCVDSW